MTINELVAESNRIEGITRKPKPAEIKTFEWFLALREVTVLEMESFVHTYEPTAVLRDKPGLDVRVGNHHPPPGGQEIREWLVDLLKTVRIVSAMEAFRVHQRFETLHPFTDCNGRSGRMLWYWMMRDRPMAQELGFLHCWYYQSLENN